ncbi:MAG: hypothetical protein AAGJ70_05060 [Pseudomonadota bacterium]
MRSLIFAAFTLTLVVAGAFIWLGPARHAHVDGPHATIAIAPPPATVLAPQIAITPTPRVAPAQPASAPQPAAATATAVIVESPEPPSRDDAGEQDLQPDEIAQSPEPRRTTEVAQPVASTGDDARATTAGAALTNDIFALPNDPVDGTLGLGVGNLGPLDQAETN